MGQQDALSEGVGLEGVASPGVRALFEGGRLRLRWTPEVAVCRLCFMAALDGCDLIADERLKAVDGDGRRGEALREG